MPILRSFTQIPVIIFKKKNFIQRVETPLLKGGPARQKSAIPLWGGKLFTKTKAWLALENGHCFEGWSFGAPGERTGEVVFHTGMTGYQEIFSDPSYKGQIV